MRRGLDWLLKPESAAAERSALPGAVGRSFVSSNRADRNTIAAPSLDGAGAGDVRDGWSKGPRRSRRSAIRDSVRF